MRNKKRGSGRLNTFIFLSSIEENCKVLSHTLFLSLFVSIALLRLSFNVLATSVKNRKQVAKFSTFLCVKFSFRLMWSEEAHVCRFTFKIYNKKTTKISVIVFRACRVQPFSHSSIFCIYKLMITFSDQCQLSTDRNEWKDATKIPMNEKTRSTRMKQSKDRVRDRCTVALNLTVQFEWEQNEMPNQTESQVIECDDSNHFDGIIVFSVEQTKWNFNFRTTRINNERQPTMTRIESEFGSFAVSFVNVLIQTWKRTDRSIQSHRKGNGQIIN